MVCRMDHNHSESSPYYQGRGVLSEDVANCPVLVLCVVVVGSGFHGLLLVDAVNSLLPRLNTSEKHPVQDDTVAIVKLRSEKRESYNLVDNLHSVEKCAALLDRVDRAMVDMRILSPL